LIVEVVAADDTARIGSPIEISIRVKNWTSRSVTLGSAKSPPWLQIDLWEQQGLDQLSHGHGEALPVITVPAGGVKILKRSVTLQPGQSPGHYVVYGVWPAERRDYPVIYVTSTVRVSADESR
jgi:hypothetical protein